MTSLLVEDTTKYSIEPRVEIVLVTPELASAWLAMNTHNRVQRSYKVRD